MHALIPFSPGAFQEQLESPTHSIFKVSDKDKDVFLSTLTSKNIVVADTIQEQLSDWAETELPGSTDAAELEPLIEKEVHASSNSIFSYGNWVLYPWRNAIAHVLPKERYWSVRSNRNRDKITIDEQSILRNRSIGVIGMSVGHACALAIAHEGLCGELRIADFDTLNLSNLNRLRSSVLHIGKNKCAIARQDIAELDPYIDVVPFDDGISENNINEFCIGDKPLDLILEECDDFFIKFRVRELAREYRIPVVMETNDRGMIDVERFDLEPERELFHGRTHGMTSEDVRDLTPERKILLFHQLVGQMESLSPRLRQSLPRIRETLMSYPQLASDVQLGGATTAHLARSVLLNTFSSSGRFYVDLNHLFREQEQDPIVY